MSYHTKKDNPPTHTARKGGKGKGRKEVGEGK